MTDDGNVSSMLYYFNEIIVSGSFFWICALVGTGMFFIQFIINLVFVGDLEHLDGGDNSASDVRVFKWLSIQTITGFLMMFGWTALTCQNEFGFQILPTLGVSLVVGIVTAYLLRFILRLSKKLHSSGSSFNLEEAIGKEAYIYQSIPKDGVGKISISLQHITHEIEAISYNSDELPSFTCVKVIKIKDDNLVVVAPI